MRTPKFVDVLDEELRNPWLRILRVLVPLMTLLVYGTVGYMAIEHFSFLDSVFMTVITVSTVGYGIVHPLSVEGEIFTLTVIVFGVIGFLYTFGVIVEMLGNGSVEQYRRKRKMQARIEGLKDHIIVCGFGRIGQQVVKEIHETGHHCVVIDTNPDRLELETMGDDPYLIGDASSDDILRAARIDAARALVSCVESDERNVYVVLTARTLNPTLFIIARSLFHESYQKLKHAGANRVLRPYVLGGRVMAIAALRPVVDAAMKLTLEDTHGNRTYVEELVIPDTAPEKVTVAMLQEQGIDILYMACADGEKTKTPDPRRILHHGDRVVVLGSPDTLYRGFDALWKQPFLQSDSGKMN